MSQTKATKAFADNLSDLIAKSKEFDGKTLKMLSENIGVSTGALSKYQNDEATASIDQLVKIADYYNVSCDWLLGLRDFSETDIDTETICERLGLSPQAVKLLESERAAKKTEKWKTTVADFINFCAEDGKPNRDVDAFESGQRTALLSNQNLFDDIMRYLRKTSEAITVMALGYADYAKKFLTDRIGGEETYRKLEESLSMFGGDILYSADFRRFNMMLAAENFSVLCERFVTRVGITKARSSEKVLRQIKSETASDAGTSKAAQKGRKTNSSLPSNDSI